MEQNWGIIGHQNIVSYLENCLNKNRLVHTYLFYGIKHLGKRTVAVKFAEKILKKPGHRQNVFTGQVSADPKKNISDFSLQSQAVNGQTRDLFELKVEAGKKDIGIEQVREWQHWLNLKSFGPGHKVGIIYQAECLNNQSANALLKTIEEPSAGTVIILITSAYVSLLPTITSRSLQIRFLPVAAKKIAAALAAKVPDHKKLSEIIDLSSGRPGLALRLAEDEDFYLAFTGLHRQVEGLWQQALSSRFSFLENFLNGQSTRDNLNLAKTFLSHFEFILRKKLLDGPITPQLFNLMNLHNRTKIILQSNIQPRLALENLLINL